MKKIWLILLLAAIACTSNGIEVKVEEMKNDLVRISVTNNSEIDYATMTFIIDYLDKDKRLLLSDTIPYHKQDGNFLPAKSNTFIVQKPPQGTQSVQVNIINP
ncbi:hypothetical protein [Mongoliitalea lutea]|uniref:Uncharacterized protein n=1 Tax=Mongoliitalea lutea TaxID=849756 RepID=A0A8J3CZK6_9BACT|nr:hypothetical protein [Mongoliitalea lutea]GHB48101.1 hypothetical protein GCM10008106_31240 [Mongoliitalea lutea]